MFGLAEEISRKHPIIDITGFNGGLDIKVHCSKIKQVNLEEFMQDITSVLVFIGVR